MVVTLRIFSIEDVPPSSYKYSWFTLKKLALSLRNSAKKAEAFSILG